MTSEYTARSNQYYLQTLSMWTDRGPYCFHTLLALANFSKGVGRASDETWIGWFLE
jgi:hypothetical protein